ncbi:serine hydrolase [Pseudoclavibacter sp. CFCC 11306]|uniref:serine hydrolase n=1 Tax=Pseudoclavibacter sp. CFCC 11306 TaxID=1564493 RepID=UPI001300FA7D|nr:serine hydrolase [Pseudoclavibacter sp. CFCC 11306]KAB1659212.1 serine hydrolase [Pseudoclavibacter sp. CFCC 11306]
MQVHDDETMQWSAKVFDIDTGEVLLEHSVDRVLNTASVGKIFLLHTVLDQVDRGERVLEEQITRRPSEIIDNSGLWYLLQADTLSVYDICTLIGAVSDNAATNTLCRVVGLDAVQQHTERLGYRDSGLDDIVRWPMQPGQSPTLSHGSARELADFVARIARGETLTSSSIDVFTRWLGAGMDCSMVASAFNVDPLSHYYYDPEVWLWNKTGTIGCARADIGVAMSQTRRVAYAVLANWRRGDDRRDEALAQMRAVGEGVRRHLLE